MATLQRSCSACVSAKRRCNLVTPHCARCTAKGITCTYVNQPVEANYHHCFNPRPQAYIPEIVRLFSPNTLQRQTAILGSFASEFATHGGTSFLHSRFYDSRLPGPLQHISGICAGYGLKEGPYCSIDLEGIRAQVGQMLRLSAQQSSFSEFLAHMQAIAFLQIICLFIEGHEDSEEGERHDKTFQELTLLLYSRAPEQLPRTLSPWRAWLFAETVRRTIIVCQIILVVRGALRHGYAVYLLCVESLPFDMRARLWDAGTADEWEAALAASHEPSLVSLSQFTTLRQPARSTSYFENLLLLSFQY